jgi:hypothetical protein
VACLIVSEVRDFPTMAKYQTDHVERVTRYLNLAAKSRQRAELAKQAHDFDLADIHTRLATGYAAHAYSAQALSRFSGHWMVSCGTAQPGGR